MDLKELAGSGAAISILRLMKEVQSKLADIRYLPDMNPEVRRELINLFQKEVIARVERAVGGKNVARKGNDRYN